MMYHELNAKLGPAPELIQALLTLCEALQVTFRWDREKQAGIMQDTLNLFVEEWLNKGCEREQAAAHDLALLRELAKLASGLKPPGILQELENRLKQTVSDPLILLC